MRKILLISLLIMTVLIVGCQQAMEETMEAQLEAETGEDAEVDLDEGKVTMKTDDGTVEMEYSNVNEDEWCQEGAEWKMTTTGADATQAKMVIVGIEGSGKYAGYCHVTYDANSDEVDMNMDFYFNEEGDGYQIMEVNGQKFETEYSG